MTYDPSLSYIDDLLGRCAKHYLMEYATREMYDSEMACWRHAMGELAALREQKSAERRLLREAADFITGNDGGCCHPERLASRIYALLAQPSSKSHTNDR